MTQLVTMSELRTRVLNRADMNPTTFVTTSELDSVIQKSWEKFYNYLVGKYEDYFAKHGDLAELTEPGSGSTGLVAGAADYLLPSEFMKLLFIGVSFDGVEVTELKRATWRQTGFATTRLGRPTHYHLYGINEPSSTHQDAIRIFPNPDRDYTAGLVAFVPVPPTIPESTGGVNFVAGWDEYVVIDSAIQILIKEETDVRPLQEERAEWLRMVENALSPRDAGQPASVVDIVGDSNEDFLDDLHG